MDQDGVVFNSSYGKEPRTFTSGERRYFDCVEKALTTMEAGEKKRIILEPKEAWGEYKESSIKRFPYPQLKGDVGQIIHLRTKRGGKVSAQVRERDEESILLDFNHPLAGKRIVFDLEVLGID
jgi:FKBP-type peptidyl-prolyl cis-trans isomerase 2